MHKKFVKNCAFFGQFLFSVSMREGKKTIFQAISLYAFSENVYRCAQAIWLFLIVDFKQCHLTPTPRTLYFHSHFDYIDFRCLLERTYSILPLLIMPYVCSVSLPLQLSSSPSTAKAATLWLVALYLSGVDTVCVLFGTAGQPVAAQCFLWLYLQTVVTSFVR